MSFLHSFYQLLITQLFIYYYYYYYVRNLSSWRLKCDMCHFFSIFIILLEEKNR